jgi:zinc D-Ala-D-Ala dipeptidase
VKNSKTSCGFFYFLFLIFLSENFFISQTFASDLEALGLVNVETLDPNLKVNMAYSTTLNFTERKVAGYFKNLCYLKEGAAQGIIRINDVLKKQSPSYRIVLRDCWRPQRATRDMLSWAEETDEKKTLC